MEDYSKQGFIFVPYIPMETTPLIDSVILKRS